MSELQPIIFNPVDTKERDKLLKFIAKLESERGQERLENGSRQPFPYNDVEKAVLYYTANEKDGGRFGRALEVLARYYLTGKVEPVHPQGVSDIRYGGHAVEVKSSAGTLTPYIYSTPEDVQALYNASCPTMARARYILYSPYPDIVNLHNIGIQRIYTQCRFMQAAESAGMLIIRSKQGLYGAGLRQFYQSNKQTDRWLQALDDVPSISVNDFFNRYAGKEG
jgi:hypothetical protein